MRASELRRPAMMRAWEELTSLFSVLGFITVTGLLFRSWEFALVVTASLGFHELGHVAALAWRRVEWRITFGLVGAWTWSPGVTRDRLSHLENIFIHLAGPFFSLGLAVIALSLQALWRPSDHHLLILANFSAQLGFLNLLPLGSLTDGGKIVRRLLLALDGPRQRKAAVLPALFSLAMLAIYALVAAFHSRPFESASFILGLLLVGVWMASSIYLEARVTARAEPLPDPLPRPSPVRPGEAYFLVLIIWDMLIFFLVLMNSTPFWMAPEYVRGGLDNVLDMLRLLAHWWFDGVFIFMC